MKNVLNKIDWFQISVIGLGLTATLLRSVYENKRFDANLDKQYEQHFEKRVEEIVEKKLKSMNK